MVATSFSQCQRREFDAIGQKEKLVEMLIYISVCQLTAAGQSQARQDQMLVVDFAMD